MINVLTREEALFTRCLDEEKKRAAARPARDSLAEFSRRAWHIVEPKSIYKHGWHIDAISEHLEAVKMGQIRDLLITIPPRCMKSRLGAVFFPSWLWIDNPEKRFIYASHSASLSKRDSIATRLVVQSEWYRREFGISWTMSEDQNEKMRFKNTAEGYRIATSIGGGATGEGGDVLVVDDPHKVIEAESEAKRKEVIDCWDHELSDRCSDPKTFARIVIMQRSHEMDLAGHILAKGGFVHLKLPMEFDSKKRCVTSIGWVDPREQEGELLWPERFGPYEVVQLKKDFGSFMSAAKLQQEPAPAGGNVVDPAWWKYYKEIPANIQKYTQSWDLSFDVTDTSSFVVGQVWGLIGANKYLLDQVRIRTAFTGQLALVKALSVKWPHTTHKWVEKKANGAALLNVLTTEVEGLIPIEPRGSKEMRAMAVSPQIESGNVWLPDPSIAPWIGDFVTEWTMFPNGANDDQVDACSQSLMMLKLMQPLLCVPLGMTGTSKWR